MPQLDKRIVLEVDAMAHVRVQRSIVYERDGGDLLLDVYAPPELAVEARRPCVLLVHGGPVPVEMPAPTRWGVFQSWAELLAASGFVACVFNHRLHTVADYQRSSADIAAALTFARTHAATHHVDPEQVAIWYFSGAGPQLSWLLRSRPTHVRCAVALYAMLDVRHLVPHDAPPELHASAAALSPSTHLRGCDLPIFIARAGRDSPMVNQGLDRFVQEALAQNARLELINHPDGEHAFECLTDDPRTRDIIQAVLDFTRRHLT